MTTREATEDERTFFSNVARLIRETRPKVTRRGELDRIDLPGGVLFRSASGGGLLVEPTTKVLGNDAASAKARTRYRPPSEDELAQWRRVQRVLEAAQPAVSGDRLIEAYVPYGLLRMGPAGLVAIQEAEPVAPLPEVFEIEEIEAPTKPAPEAEPDVIDWPLTPGPTLFECGECGRQVPEEATACPHCGTVFAIDAPTQVSAVDAGIIEAGEDLQEGLVPASGPTGYRHPRLSSQRIKHRGRAKRCPICGGACSRDGRMRPIHVADRDARFKFLRIIDLQGGKQVSLTQSHFRPAPLTGAAKEQAEFYDALVARKSRLKDYNRTLAQLDLEIASARAVVEGRIAEPVPATSARTYIGDSQRRRAAEIAQLREQESYARANGKTVLADILARRIEKMLEPERDVRKAREVLVGESGF